MFFASSNINKSSIYISGFFLIAANNAYANNEVIKEITLEGLVALTRDHVKNLVAPGLLDNQIFGLSTVGSLGNKDNLSTLLRQANSCQESDYYINTNTPRRLSSIYEKIISDSTSPNPTQQEQESIKKFKEWRSVNLDKWNKYEEFRKKDDSLKIKKALMKGLDWAEITKLNQETDNLSMSWALDGYRLEVLPYYELYRRQVTAANRVAEHTSLLSTYRWKSASLLDVPMSTNLDPYTVFSPPIEKWAETEGWVDFKFSTKQVTQDHYKKTVNRTGKVGWGFSFMKFKAGAGSSSTTETKVDKLKSVDISFKVKRVEMLRYWFDDSLLFDTGKWTWKKQGDTANFPYISKGKGTGINYKQLYDGFNIACPAIPYTGIIMKDIVLTAAMDTKDYEKKVKNRTFSGKSGIFGFGASAGSDTKIEELDTNDKNTTFRIKGDSGVTLVGLISFRVPIAPVPNESYDWPEDAWKPSN